MDDIRALVNQIREQEKNMCERERERARYRDTIVLGKDGFLHIVGDPDCLHVTNQITGISYKAKVKVGVVVPLYLGLPVRFSKNKDCDYGWITGVDVDSLHMTQDMNGVQHNSDNSSAALEYFELVKGWGLDEKPI